MPSTAHGWSLSGGVCVSRSGGRYRLARKVDLARVGGRLAVLPHPSHAGARGRLRQRAGGRSPSTMSAELARVVGRVAIDGDLALEVAASRAECHHMS